MENLNILDEVYFYDDFYKVVGFGIITSTVSKNKETKRTIRKTITDNLESIAKAFFVTKYHILGL